MNKSSNSRGFRSDIQALRGFAVLTVLFYHAEIGLFSAGYLGVDIFFVISGFLITRLIADGIRDGGFRLSDFYLRRAKRLLPAAYVTFFFTSLFAPVFLTGAELSDFGAQLLGAVTFTANIVLLNQSGYFGGESDLKPLLHVWSLAIEEQYYFILPAILLISPRRLWLWVVSSLLVFSLFLCVLNAGMESTFYLLQSRAWELMIGSAGALLAGRIYFFKIAKVFFWPALFILLILPIAKIDSYRFVELAGYYVVRISSLFEIEAIARRIMDLKRFHPGLDSLLICLATAIVILRHHPALAQGALLRGMSAIGDMSYSLYLVHWPLFAFFNNAWIGDLNEEKPLSIRLLLIALSLGFGFLLNRHVEVPMRQIDTSQASIFIARAAAASITFIMASAGIAYATSSVKDYGYIRRLNYGLDEACDFEGDFEPIPECRNSANPEVLLWGDSFAMHLAPGISNPNGDHLKIIQATRSACGPLLGFAEVDRRKGRDEAWAANCIRFNDSVAAYLTNTPSIKAVALSSPFQQSEKRTGYHLVRKNRDEDRHELVDSGPIPAMEGLRATVNAIRALGKRVVIVAPPPSSNFDIGRCLERLEGDLPITGVSSSCQIRVDSYKKNKAQILEFLGAVRGELDVDVIQFDDYLCGSEYCRTYIDGKFIYRDQGHLSYDGSALLAKGTALAQQIVKSAR